MQSVVPASRRGSEVSRRGLLQEGRMDAKWSCEERRHTLEPARMRWDLYVPHCSVMPPVLLMSMTKQTCRTAGALHHGVIHKPNQDSGMLEKQGARRCMALCASCHSAGLHRPWPTTMATTSLPPSKGCSHSWGNIVPA